MSNTASIYANVYPQLRIFLCFQRVDDIPPLFSILLIFFILFRILKTLASTTVSEINDSWKNFVLPEGLSTWVSMGHKNRETTQVFERITERQQAKRIFNQYVNLFRSSSRRLRILRLAAVC